MRVLFLGGLPKEGLVKSCQGISEGAGSLALEERGVGFKARQVSVKLPAGAKGRRRWYRFLQVCHMLPFCNIERKESESDDFTSLKRANQST